MQNFQSPAVKVQPSGVGFPHLLTLLFIGLRLAGVIDWSWAWVLFPLWGPLAFVLFLAAVMFGFSLLAAVVTTPKRNP